MFYARSNTRPAILLFPVGLLAIELLIVSLSVDAYTLLKNQNLEDWQKSFAYFGRLAKFLVLAAFVFAVIRKQKLLSDVVGLAESFSIRRFFGVLPFQLLIYAVFLFTTVVIFGSPAHAHELSKGWFLAWPFLALSTVACWLITLSSFPQIIEYFRREKLTVMLTLVTSVAASYMAQISSDSWGVLADKTFSFSSFLLSGYAPELLHLNRDDKTLGLGNFVVSIAPVCSGYEGIGLITAFTALYLFLYRDELRFPRALLLFPIGAVVIWLLNGVRIAALIAIGHHWSPQIAIGGFHSQAGWITFILTSLGLLWLAGSSGLLSRSERVARVCNDINLPIATLIPLVVLLAVTLLSSAFTHSFDYFYPVRVVAVVYALYKILPYVIELRPFVPRWEGLVAAVLVAVLWIVMLGDNQQQNENFQSGLDSMPVFAAGAWLVFRFIGSVVTVPIAEELAFRGYLLCKLSRVNVEVRGGIPFSIVAVAISSLAFGALHGAWLAGTVAGVVYAVVRIRTGHIGDAILAHAGTNALLFLYASVTGQWWLL